jgi:ketosteroid isomerase-like protein
MEFPDFKTWKETTDTSRRVIEDAMDALARADNDAFLSLFHDDFEWTIPGTGPVSGTKKGMKSFLELIETVADRLEVYITVKVTNLIACGEWVITESLGDSLTKKGEPYNQTYCHLWRVENGKIARYIEYHDTDLLLKVLFRE